MSVAPFAVKTPLGEAIADYSGRTVISIEVFPDPVMRDVFAVQAVVGARHLSVTSFKTRRAAEANTTLEFIVKGVRIARVTADDLEEVQFTSWPPEVR